MKPRTILKASCCILLLLDFHCAFARKVYNVFKPGQEYNCWTCDFMKENNLRKGDTVVISAGTYGHTVIANCYGITFQNKGQVVFNGGFNFELPSAGNKLIGNGTKGLFYGIRIENAKQYFAGRWYSWGDMEIGWIKVSKMAMGFQVKIDPGLGYDDKTATLYAHDLLIEDVEQEGIYFGTFFGPGERPAYITNSLVQRVYTNRTGRDGIQLRVGKFTVKNCRVTHYGINKESGQDMGLSLGSDGSYLVQDCYIANGSGVGVFFSGVDSCILQCDTIIKPGGESAIFAKNYENEGLYLHWKGFQQLTVQNCIIEGHPVALNQYCDPAKGRVLPTLFESNRTSGLINTEVKGSFIHNNNPFILLNCRKTLPNKKSTE